MKTTEKEEKVNINATKDMARYCFDVIRHKLGDLKKLEYPKKLAQNEIEVPMFVTFEHFNGSEYILRGCIGTFDPIDLVEGLKTYSLKSAFSDSRFIPIRKSELKELKCTVNLLVKFEKGKDLEDWKIGKHGVRIEFLHPEWGIMRSSTYLPSVAVDFGWNKEKTIKQLYKKAGYRGFLTMKLKDNTELIKYQSSKVELTYEDYLKML